MPDIQVFQKALMSEGVMQGLRSRLTSDIDPNFIVRAAMSSLARKDSRGQRLRDCTPDSVVLSLYDAAQHGLPPDDVRGLAYLVPYGSECRLIIGYRGLIVLAMQSGRFKYIDAFLACDGDEYDLQYGTDPLITHTPKVGPKGDASNVIGAYAIAVLTDGTRIFDWLWRTELERAMGASKAKSGDTPWKSWPTEMMKKTAVRRLCSHKLAFLPEISAAITAMDAVEFDDDVKTVESTVVAEPEDVLSQAVKASVEMFADPVESNP